MKIGNVYFFNIKRSKKCIQIGDIAIHMEGHVGIVTEVRYNKAEEVEIQWLTAKSRASRTSIMFLREIVRTRIIKERKG